MFVILEYIVAVKTKIGGDSFYEVGRFNSEIFNFISPKNPNCYSFDSNKYKLKTCIEFEETLFSPILESKMEILIIEKSGDFITSFICTGSSFLKQIDNRGSRYYRLHLNLISKLERVETIQKERGEYILDNFI